MVLITNPGMEMEINHTNLNTLGVLSFVLCLPHIGTAFVSASWKWEVAPFGYTWQPQADMYLKICTWVLNIRNLF